MAKHRFLPFACLVAISLDVLAASSGRATADGAFTARAMVDAITAPDILSTIMERILRGRR